MGALAVLNRSVVQMARTCALGAQGRRFKSGRSDFIRMRIPLILLNTLHIFNDGYQASFLLLLPFIAKNLGISLTQIGSLGSFFYLFETVLSLPVGYLGERVNGFKIVLFSTFLVGLSFFGITFISDYPQLMLFYVLAGIGFALFHPMAFALVASWTSKGSRGKSMGDFTAVGDLGRIGMSAVMTYVAVFVGWRRTSLYYAAAVFLLFAVLALFLRRVRTAISRSHGFGERVAVVTLLKNRRFIYACLTALLDSASSSSLFIFLPFLLMEKGINPTILGSFTAAYFLGNFFGKSVIGRLTDRIGSVKTFILSEIFMGVFILLLTGTSSLVYIVIFSVFLGFLTKGTVPARATMAIEAVEHHGRFEKAVAVLGLIASIGTAGAPYLYGRVADRYGITVSFYCAAAIALLAIVPAVLFRYTPHPKK